MTNTELIDRIEGWAIKFKAGHYDKIVFMGRYYFSPCNYSPQFGGYRTAVYNTRREAREAKAKSPRIYLGPVVKVRVHIEEIKS